MYTQIKFAHPGPVFLATLILDETQVVRVLSISDL